MCSKARINKTSNTKVKSIAKQVSHVENSIFDNHACIYAVLMTDSCLLLTRTKIFDDDFCFNSNKFPKCVSSVNYVECVVSAIYLANGI